QENIELLTPYTVTELLPGESGALAKAVLVHSRSGETREIEITGAFVAIGHEPQSELVRGQIDVDDEGYVRVDGRSTRPNRPGVFAAGDVAAARRGVTARVCSGPGILSNTPTARRSGPRALAAMRRLTPGGLCATRP